MSNGSKGVLESKEQIEVVRRWPNGFLMLSKATAENTNLGFEALGLLTYLLSKPPGWRVMRADIERRGDIGKDRALKIIKQLIDAGYLERRKVRDNAGAFVRDDIVVSDVLMNADRETIARVTAKNSAQPIPSSPQPENPPLDRPAPASPAPVLPEPEKPALANPAHSKEPTVGKNLKEKEVSNETSVQGPPTKASLQEAVDAYNAVAKAHGLSKVQRLGGTRERLLRKALATHGLDGWMAAMRNIPKSPHLIGRSKANWLCDFDWLLRSRDQDNLLKIIEGGYFDRSAKSAAARLPGSVAEENAEKARVFREKFGDVASLSDEVWDMHLSASYRPDHGTAKPWFREYLGPAPGVPGCLVPSRVLESFGFKPKSTVAA